MLPDRGPDASSTDVALDDGGTETLRIAAFAGVAESAKRSGSRLADGQLDAVMQLAFDEPNLRLRAAAGRALGALNPAAHKASRIPLKFHGG